MRADNARSSIQRGSRPASRAQAYSQQSTTTSTITSTSTSTSMPVGLELYRLFPYDALAQELFGSLLGLVPYPSSFRYSVFRSSLRTLAARALLFPTASRTRRM